MAKILEFPEDRCIQKNLHVAKETLKDMYDSIKMCYSTIEKLEEKIQETEHEYDVLFTQYVKAWWSRQCRTGIYTMGKRGY